MKYTIFILIFLTAINCYNKDSSDPGSTEYCKNIGLAMGDKECEMEDDHYTRSFEYSILASIGRCADPNSVKDLNGHCFVENRSDLFRIVNETADSITISKLSANQVSKTQNVSIASVCIFDSETTLDTSSIYKSIFEYNPDTRSATKLLHKQNPTDSAHKELINARDSRFKQYLVPLKIDQNITAKWIVTFSGLYSSCERSVGLFDPPEFHFFLATRYQILEVVE
ncbi:hypothetical protein [Leptospira sp. GIMC2001]|uniref:hypothetical protein n=1 Tax=Leptospira sp. GIMC2001 TaxID=1513297 RepID=UPI00234BEE86|nr:hypothetical protein [Leptospira sp. GIMC2001]WCL50870.1 hypothetical protein O4O04_08670 [Leptospira sp. GIMC2001]